MTATLVPRTTHVHVAGRRSFARTRQRLRMCLTIQNFAQSTSNISQLTFTAKHVTDGLARRESRTSQTPALAGDGCFFLFLLILVFGGRSFLRPTLDLPPLHCHSSTLHFAVHHPGSSVHFVVHSFSWQPVSESFCPHTWSIHKYCGCTLPHQPQLAEQVRLGFPAKRSALAPLSTTRVPTLEP